jgi:hypothetical protein
MKNLITVLIISFLSNHAFAEINIQPIVGYERVQKISPTPHSVDRAVFGARLIYGPPLFSLEAEVTKSNDTENFTDRNLTIKEDTTAAKLGIRSSFSFPFVRWYLRAGGSGKKSIITETSGGVSTEREPAIYVSPYAGTGLTVNVKGMFTADAGITVIFTGQPKGSDREYQTTLGFGVKI